MNTTARTWLKSGVIGLAGLAAGGVLATTVAATAEDAGSGDNGGQTDPRSDEQPLTGDTADQVRAAALAEYPGATVVRLETESDGGYEAHLVKADGTPVTVLVDEDFEVTGEEEGGFGHHGGFGGPGGRGGSGEEELSGDDAAGVREAALAEYPGATVVRVETDSDGVYEAHLLKADGTPVTVEVNADFEVTGEEEGGFGHGFGDSGDDSEDDSTTQGSSDSV
jgi:uncharacterized membrane protein YkoI